MTRVSLGVATYYKTSYKWLLGVLLAFVLCFGCFSSKSTMDEYERQSTDSGQNARSHPIWSTVRDGIPRAVNLDNVPDMEALYRQLHRYDNDDSNDNHDAWGSHIAASLSNDPLACEESSLADYNFPVPSWCSHLNPFSTQDLPIYLNNESMARVPIAHLSEVMSDSNPMSDQFLSRIHDIDAHEWHWKPYCFLNPTHDVIGNESCQVVSTFASGSVGSKSYVLYGHYTGYVTFHRFTISSKLLEKFDVLQTKGPRQPSLENAIDFLDVVSVDSDNSFFLAGTQRDLSVYAMNTSFVFEKKHHLHLKAHESFSHAQFFTETDKDGNNHYALIAIENRQKRTARLRFISLHDSHVDDAKFEWQLTNLGPQKLSIGINQQAIEFREVTQYQQVYGRVDMDATKFRTLFTLTDGREVKILGFDPELKKVTIAFGDRKSVSTFFTLQTSHSTDAAPTSRNGESTNSQGSHDMSGLSIASAQLAGQNVRSFNTSSLSCNHVDFLYPSQEMVLVVALNGDQTSIIKVRHVPEHALWDTSTEHDAHQRVLNPGDRPFSLHDSFPCTNEFYNQDTHQCETVPTFLKNSSEWKVESMQAKVFGTMKEILGSYSAPSMCKYKRDTSSCLVGLSKYDRSCQLSGLLFEWEQGILLENTISIFVRAKSREDGTSNNIHVFNHWRYIDQSDDRTQRNQYVEKTSRKHVPHAQDVEAVEHVNDETKQEAAGGNNYFREGLYYQGTHEFESPINQNHVSPNGVHSWVSIAHSRWQYESYIRFTVICDQLKQDPSNVFLQPYKEACDQQVPLDMSFFIRYNSMCYPGKVCASLTGTNIDYPILDGLFTVYPNYMMPCPDGYFCVKGELKDCPPGFRCPSIKPPIWIRTWSDLYPTKCLQHDYSDSDTPWYSSRTCTQMNTGEVPPLCPNGTICPNSASLPVFVPPNYWLFYTKEERQSQNTSQLAPTVSECHPSEWCPLGAYAIGNRSLHNASRQILCPAGTFCPDPTVLTPQLCNCSQEQCDYCPAGSQSRELCPPGYYCTDPRYAKSCPRAYSCNEPGTTIPELCPEGYYCEDGIEIICPKGHYCKRGTTSPIKCGFLSYCPPGSQREVVPTLSLVTVIVVLGAIYSMYIVLGTVIPYIRSSKRLFASKTSSPDCTNQMDTIDSTKSQSSQANPDTETNFLIPKPRLKKTFNIGFEKLNVKLRDGRTILSAVSGQIKPGRTFCILGPSGAGKTTFLSALRGTIDTGKVSGKVTVNGKPSSLSKFSSYTAFIPQEDIMLTDLTVREILVFTARVKLPISTSVSSIHRIVDEVLEDLGLTHIQHQLIGNVEQRGISGGERKRTSLAMALVQNVSILCCDEITSGLDSRSALSLIKCLKGIASRGYSLITILHQPSVQIFELIDDVLLLGKGGRPLYCGPRGDVMQYFEELGYVFPNNMNPCDHLLDICSGYATPKGEDYMESEECIDRLHKSWSRSIVSQLRSSKVESNSTSMIGSLNASESEVDHSFMSPTNKHNDLNNTDEIIHSPSDVYGMENANGPQAYADDRERNEGLHISSKLDDAREFLSRRPSFFWQLIMCIFRAFIQQIRDIKGLFLEFILVGFSSACLGIVFNNKSYIGPIEKSVWMQCPEPVRDLCKVPRADYLIQEIYLCAFSIILIGSVTSLRVFGGQEKIVFTQRESAYLSTLPFFIGKNLAYIPNALMSPALLVMMVRFLVGFHIGFLKFYAISLMGYMIANGIGFCLSLLLPWSLSLLTAVIFTLTLGFFGGNVPPIPQIRKMIFPICYFPEVNPMRWTMETMYLLEIKTYEDTYDISLSLNRKGFKFSHFWTGIYVLLAWLVLIRVVGYLILLCIMPNNVIRRFFKRVRWFFIDIRVWMKDKLCLCFNKQEQYSEI